MEFVEEFSRWWRPRFASISPLGHLLRQGLPQRWVRFHSLPESKRYADSEKERALLLGRQFKIAEAVVGDASSCFIVVPFYEVTELGNRHEILEFPDLSFVCARQMERGDVGTSFLVAKGGWEDDCMRNALLAIADDQIRVLWVGVDRGEVFAPYDGGVDCILSTPERRDALALRFQDWLSKREDGL